MAAPMLSRGVGAFIVGTLGPPFGQKVVAKLRMLTARLGLFSLDEGSEIAGTSASLSAIT